jgi:hypothetical protein
MHATQLLECHCGLTVHIGTGALQTIHEEIQAHQPGIEVLGYETGGGIFGPPIRGWHNRANVAIATVAAGPRRPRELEIAYGKIEATEANLIRIGSQLRRIGVARPPRVSSRPRWRTIRHRHEHVAARTRPHQPQPLDDPVPRRHRNRRPAWMVFTSTAARLGRPTRRARPTDLRTRNPHRESLCTRGVTMLGRGPAWELVTDVGDLAERALRKRGRVNPCARHRSRNGDRAPEARV